MKGTSADVAPDVEEEPTTSPDLPAPDAGTGPPAVRRLAAVAVAAAGAAGVWIVTAVITAGHGFDTSDEGYYLLSYRWWHTDLRTFTGVQYLYGPVFQALGYDIAGLRLFRLVTVVATHAAFGWAFMRWLRQRRPHAPPSRWWEIAGTATIVACGGMVYCWLPLSPGYNDVSLLGALLAAAVVLRMGADVDRGRRVPAWVAAALGPIAVAMLLAKWTSGALTLLALAVVAVVVLAPRGWREIVRLATWTSAGALLTVAMIQFFVIPLTAAVPQMLATNKLVAAHTNSPTALLDMYARSSYQVLEAIAKGHGLLLLAAILAVLVRGRVARVGTGVLAAAGLAFSAWRLVADHDLEGGTVNLSRFPIGVLLALAVATVTGLTVLLDRRRTGAAAASLLRREGGRGWAVLALLALLPVLQAAGTGNPLHYMAVNGYAAWAAIILAVLTGIESAPEVARWLVAAATGGAVLLSATIATNGLWAHPYRTKPYPLTTAVARGVPALSSIRLDPATARSYAHLHALLLPYLRPEGRAIMAFDGMSGIVLLLDGRPVGEAWYSAIDRERTAAGIRLDCPGGHGWWGTRSPILIFRRPVSDTELGALRSCGLVFATDYRLLGSVEETEGLQVYVPTAVPAEGQR